MKKIGILGGGQLGRMFLQNAMNYPFEYWILDPSENAPAKHLCHHFVQGDFNDYDTVLKFGNQVDVLGIEIEHVNVEAIKTLEKEGLKVIPNAKTLEIIQDKGAQKELYVQHNIPTSNFYAVKNASEIKEYPCVQKLRKGGYDGKGVKVLHSSDDFILNKEWIIEELIEIEKELAIIVVKQGNNIEMYPVVEMIFDEQLNLVNELFAPANINNEIEKRAIEIANQVVSAFNADGIYAIELFLTKDGKVLVNETAPRVHNSGHHTIEANYISQFDAMLRLLADLPLGNCKEIREEATMLNLVGSTSQKINTERLKEIVQNDKTYFHWYGKTENRAGRKMGHITILGKRNEKVLKKIENIKQEIKDLL